MTQQKSEDRIVPKGRGNSTSTRGVEPPGGGKAIPVKGEDRQLMLFFTAAENPRGRRGAEGASNRVLTGAQTRKVPKVKGKRSQAGPARMEEVIEGLLQAFDKVSANKGAPGPDRQTIAQVHKRLPDIEAVLRRSLLDGSYMPGEIRRVWIPKAGGTGQ